MKVLPFSLCCENLKSLTTHYHCPTLHPSCNTLPVSNLAGLTSMPIILLAPAVLHPIATARPTAPRPQMAQFEPASTFAVLRAAPYPVGTPQPNKHTLSKGAVSLICYIQNSSQKFAQMFLMRVILSLLFLIWK